MMNAADSKVAPATNHMHARCSLLDSRSQPKIQIPRNVDSRKKAKRPSIASGPPKMLPT